MKNSVMALGLIVAVAAQAAPPTVEEVGDPDSFGRDVIYLGNAQTANVVLQGDCTPDPAAPPLPNDRCITLAAQRRRPAGTRSGSRRCSCHQVLDDPGEREQRSMFLSRHCIGGLVSKRSLVGSGLSEAQAKQFFRKPMTFTFGSSGTVQMVDFANYFYGIRLYGDSKDK